MTHKPETTDTQLKKCVQIREIFWGNTGIYFPVNSIHQALYPFEKMAKSAKELANSLRLLQRVWKPKRRAIVRHKK